MFAARPSYRKIALFNPIVSKPTNVGYSTGWALSLRKNAIFWIRLAMCPALGIAPIVRIFCDVIPDIIQFGRITFGATPAKISNLALGVSLAAAHTHISARRIRSESESSALKLLVLRALLFSMRSI